MATIRRSFINKVLPKNPFSLDYLNSIASKLKSDNHVAKAANTENGNINIGESYPGLFPNEFNTNIHEDRLKLLNLAIDTFKNAPSNEGIQKLFEEYKSKNEISSVDAFQQMMAVALSGLSETIKIFNFYKNIPVIQDGSLDVNKCSELAAIVVSTCKAYHPSLLKTFVLNNEKNEVIHFSYVIDIEKIYVAPKVKDYTYKDFMFIISKSLSYLAQVKQLCAPMMNDIKTKETPSTIGHRHILGVIEFFYCLSNLLIDSTIPKITYEDLKSENIVKKDNGNVSVSATSVNQDVSISTEEFNFPDQFTDPELVDGSENLTGLILKMLTGLIALIGGFVLWLTNRTASSEASIERTDKKIETVKKIKKDFDESDSATKQKKLQKMSITPRSSGNVYDYGFMEKQLTQLEKVNTIFVELVTHADKVVNELFKSTVQYTSVEQITKIFNFENKFSNLHLDCASFTFGKESPIIQISILENKLPAPMNMENPRQDDINKDLLYSSIRKEYLIKTKNNTDKIAAIAKRINTFIKVEESKIKDKEITASDKFRITACQIAISSILRSIGMIYKYESTVTPETTLNF